MITIEASNINVGGSLNLLKDLAEYVNKHNVSTIVYVSYDEVYKQMNSLNLNCVELVKTNLFSTLLRYMKKRRNVLFFCSLPPFVSNDNSYVYFHAEYYADALFEGGGALTCYERIKKIAYYFILFFFNKNCSAFFCQTERIREKLNRTYGIEAEVRPFFKRINIDYSLFGCDKKYDFIYPALCSKHKNHINLLRAVKSARRNANFNILLTIPNTAKDILELVDDINNSYPETIVNIGVVNQSVIRDCYCKSKYLIFPSLMESLGLPLLEAVDFNLIVLAADREYVFSAIDNPVVFDPESVDSIASCMQNALNGLYDNTNQKALLKDSKEYIVQCLNSI